MTDELLEEFQTHLDASHQEAFNDGAFAALTHAAEAIGDADMVITRAEVVEILRSMALRIKQGHS
jgi:hypothetical protein